MFMSLSYANKSFLDWKCVISKIYFSRLFVAKVFKTRFKIAIYNFLTQFRNKTSESDNISLQIKLVEFVASNMLFQLSKT